MDTYLTANGIDCNKLIKNDFKSHLSHLDKADRSIEIQRPAPTPPIDSRPTKLSVTSIDKWMKDPYSIYAQKILRLDKLPNLNEAANAADRGNLFHEILHRFNKKYAKNLDNVTSDNFIDIALDVLNENEHINEGLSFWRPRLLAFAEKYLTFEKEWRNSYTPLFGEIQGHINLKDATNNEFTLSARVDRIDRHNNGNFAIVDYKSGGQFSLNKILSGEHAQLPLEGLILTEGKFDKIATHENTINYLGYWTINNASQAIKETAINDNSKINQSITDTKSGLVVLIQTYQNKNTPYIAIPDLNNAPRFNDYEHLERVKEWAALGEDESEGSY
jgi:ATP-dependent helicase/nuclease subunit B